MFSSKKQENFEAVDLSKSSNHIGEGTIFKGNIEATGNLRIDGRVEGDIDCKAKLVLGVKSFVLGNVRAQSTEVEGTVEGTLTVSGVLALKPSAQIHGDIHTEKLIIEQGATFNGKCQMGDLPQKKINNAGQEKKIRQKVG